MSNSSSAGPFTIPMQAEFFVETAEPAVRRRPHPQQPLLDELAVRLVMERRAVEIYDIALERLPIEADATTREDLRHKRLEHHAHVGLLVDMIQKIGGEVDHQPPLAQAIERASRGMTAVLRSPGLSLYHAYRVVYSFESMNFAGWRVLSDIIRQYDQREDVRVQLQTVIQDEQRKIARLHQQLSSLFAIEAGYIPTTK